jgi:hypothetical protein
VTRHTCVTRDIRCDSRMCHATRAVPCRAYRSYGGLWFISGYDQIQSNGDLRSLAAPIGFGANR